MESMGSEEHAYECDWVPVKERQGNWVGHIFPGLVFVVWGTHWLIGMYMRYFEAKRAQRPYTAQSTEHLFPFAKPCLRASQRVPIESILKATGAFLLFFLQLYYGAYKWLSCPAGSPRSGHIATQHLNSWAHAAMNLGFSVSGIVELLGYLYQLPNGTQQGFLSLAFFLEYILMGLHEKHGSLDSMLHRLLAYTMMAGSFFAGLECVWSNSLPLSAARAVSMILQGSWFCQSGNVLFGGHIFWQDMVHDPKGNMISEMGPAMALPVFFTFHVLCASFFALLVFVAVAIRYDGQREANEGAGHGLGTSPYAYERTGLLSDIPDAGDGLLNSHRGPHKAVPMQTLS